MLIILPPDMRKGRVRPVVFKQACKKGVTDASSTEFEFPAEQVREEIETKPK